MKPYILILVGILFIFLIIIILVFLIRSVFFPPTVAVPTPTPTPIIALTPTPTLIPTPTPTPNPTSTPIPNPTTPPQIIIINPTPTPTPQPVQLFRIFRGPGFSLSFPQNWSLLTCLNSQNFEMDPFGRGDQRIICTSAQEPITIILQNNLSNCPGDSIMVGNTPVLKSTSVTSEFNQIKWCTQTQPVLSITHRISSIPQPAVSVVDFSADIENMISSLQTTTSLPQTSM